MLRRFTLTSSFRLTSPYKSLAMPATVSINLLSKHQVGDPPVVLSDANESTVQLDPKPRSSG